MRVTHSDFKNGEVRVIVDNADDLWYLSTIVDIGDHVKGQTVRKFKYGDEKQQVERKKVFLKIQVEKIDFNPELNNLKILGIITEGPEDVPHGQHHSFDIEEGTSISIEKKEWLDFQKKRLEDASKQKFMKVLVCVLDREEAFLIMLKKFGYDIVSKLKGDVAKKNFETGKEKNFYEEIIAAIKELDGKRNFDSIVIASPAFWKEDFMKNLKDPGLKKKILLATCSSCDEKSINEVLKRPEVTLALKKERVAQEIGFVDNLLAEISKDALYAYGMKDTEEAVNMGAANILIVTDRFLRDCREKGHYDMLEGMMKTVEKNKGEVHIISTQHDGGKKLDGVGGIGAILRYKIK